MEGRDTTQRVLKLYQCSAPNNELHKDKWLSNEKVISPYVPKDNNSISNPHIIIHTFEQDDEHPVSLLAYNYCYIDDYQRYYFIEDMILLPQGQVELVCKVDVLYSFKNSIGELVVHETRATNGTSNYLVDEEVATQINAKPVVLPFEFNDGEKLQGSDYNDICYVVRYFANYLYNELPDGTSGNEASAASKTDLTGIFPSDVTPSATQIEIGQKIANFAINSYNGYHKYLHGIFNSGFYSYACVYVNPNWSQSWNESERAIAVNRRGIIDQNLGGSHDKVPCTRYDACDSVYATVAFGGTTRNTGLNIVDVSAIEDWNENHPNAEVDTDLIWNGWDCSQFAWRCCLFNGTTTPIDIGSETVGNGKSNSTTAGELEFLSNRGCLVHQVATLADLMPGDLIFSGHGDGTGRYFVGYDDTKPEGQKWVSGERGVNSSDGLTNLIDINHVRIYIGNGEYIDTNTNSWDGTEGDSIPEGNLFKDDLGKISAKLGDSNYTQVPKIVEGSKYIRVCRPSLLWGSAYQR